MIRKIKIARVIARMIIGGPTKHVLLLNDRLDPERFESILVTGRGNPGEADLLDSLLAQGGRTIVIPEIVGEANFGLRDLMAILKLWLVLRRERPEIVHTHTTKAGFVGRVAAWLARVPIIIHTYHGHVLRGYYSPLKSRLLRWLEKMLVHLSTVVIAVSPTVANELVELGVVRRSKIRVVPLGLELDQFSACDSLRGQLRAELKIPIGSPLIGIAGRIVPIKNHRLFLDAARQVLDQVPNSYFLVIGDGLGRLGLEQYAREIHIRSNVIFTGWRLDLPRVYADLNVLVVSSINEGTPVSAIEAMAAGCPIVATRVGGIPDVVRDGFNGYLTPSGNVDSMADRIIEILKYPEIGHRMGDAGRQLALANFMAPRLVRDIEHIYCELLAQ